jgi:hypothetical protein
LRFKASPGQIVHKALPQKKKKRAGGVAQVVEDLPSKREALRSNPMLKKKQQGKKPAG